MMDAERRNRLNPGWGWTGIKRRYQAFRYHSSHNIAIFIGAVILMVAWLSFLYTMKPGGPQALGGGTGWGRSVPAGVDLDAIREGTQGLDDEDRSRLESLLREAGG